MPKIRYTKIYPNIYQVLFAESLVKSHVNSLIGERIGYIKAAGEEFFKKYQDTAIENVKKSYDYANRLFMIDQSKLIIQIEKDGKRYMFPTSSFKKVFQFLKARGVTKFPPGYTIYKANEQGNVDFTDNNIKSHNSDDVDLNQHTLQDWLTGPVRQLIDTKYQAVYKEFWKNNMRLPTQDIIMFDGTKIKGKQLIFTGEYNIQLICKTVNESRDILVHVTGEKIDMPDNLEFPVPLFSEYIGTKATEIDFNERPLIKELNRFDQFKKDIEGRIERKETQRINKKINEYEQLKSRLKVIDQHLKGINEERVNKLRSNVYNEERESFKNQTNKLESIAKGTLHNKLIDNAKNLKQRSINPNDEFTLKSKKMMDFIDMVKITYNESIKYKIDELDHRDPSTVYEAVKTIIDKIDLYLDDIKYTSGKYFVVRGTMKNDDIEVQLEKLKKSGFRLLEHMQRLDMI